MKICKQFKKVYHTCDKWLLSSIVFIETLLLSTPVMASTSETLGSRFRAMLDEVDSLKNLMIAGFIVAGIGLFGVGVVKLTKHKNEGGGLAPALILILSGAILASLTTAIALTSMTVTNTSPGFDIK